MMPTQTLNSDQSEAGALRLVRKLCELPTITWLVPDGINRPMFISLNPGTRFGHCEIRSKIGEGRNGGSLFRARYKTWGTPGQCHFDSRNNFSSSLATLSTVRL